MEYRDPCEDEGELGSGWFYWDDMSDPSEFWVSAEEFATWEWCQGGEWCDNEWFWEDCSGMEWRDPCEWEGE